MFKYRFELMGNPEFVSVHTTLRFHDERYTDESHELVGIISGLNGVENGCLDIRVYRNHVCIPVGRAFDRLEIAAQVLDLIKLWAGAECEPSGPVIYPYRETHEQGEFAMSD